MIGPRRLCVPCSPFAKEVDTTAVRASSKRTTWPQRPAARTSFCSSFPRSLKGAAASASPGTTTPSQGPEEGRPPLYLFAVQEPRGSSRCQHVGECCSCRNIARAKTPHVAAIDFILVHDCVGGAWILALSRPCRRWAGFPQAVCTDSSVCMPCFAKK